ncbi:MAG: hypothetical protein VR72_13525 [Clostridiaceae bacterium BRH_c20a]|nr:MAG: hypothetical protein VR72_13525 [Clostridiaceae bacterium BRH_c20a]
MIQGTYFTVRELLNLQVLKNSEVLAGNGGLDRQVSNVTFFDAPDAINWVKGNELVVTTMYPFRDTVSQKLLVEELAKKGASALGIKLKRYIDALPAEILEIAERHSLPILSIPYECAWVDLINPIMAEILNRQLVKLETSERIHKSFVEEVLQDGQLNSIAKTLHNLIKKPITIFELFSFTSTTYPDLKADTDIVLTELLNQQEKYSKFIAYKLEKLIKDCVLFVVPIRIAQKTEGYVVVWESNSLSEIDIIAVEHAATVSALQIQKLKSVSETRRRFKDDLINILLRGEESIGYNLKKRAQELGWKLGVNNIILVVNVSGINHGGQNWAQLQNLYELVSRFMIKGRLDSIPLGVDRSDRIVIIFSWEEQEKIPVVITDFAEKLKKAIREKNFDFKIGIGIGSCKQKLDNIPESFEEACIAAKVSLLSEKDIESNEYGKIGVYKVISELLNSQKAERIVSEILQPIISHDQAYNINLLETLEVFLKQDCNFRSTSKCLYIHHNTVRYRINLIEELCKINLRDPNDKLNVHLAINFYKYSKSF